MNDRRVPVNPGTTMPWAETLRLSRIRRQHIWNIKQKRRLHKSDAYDTFKTIKATETNSTISAKDAKTI